MSWNTYSLGEVCTFENGDRGKNYPSRSKFVLEGIPFVNAGHLNEGVIQLDGLNYITRDNYDLISRGKFSPGDILFCLRGSLGKYALVEELTEGAIASSLVIIRVSELLNIHFFLLYLQSSLCKEMIEKYAGGAAQPNLGAKDLAKFTITLPPIQEQKRIVAFLDTVFADLEQTRVKTGQNLKNARELFESTCSNSIFSAEVIPSTTVSDVAKNEKGSMRTGPFGSQLLKKEIVDSGIAVLGIDNAVNNSFQWGAKRFITPEKFEELSRFEVKPGDVLITIMGTCGRCAIVPENIPKAINTKHICCITLDKSRCLPEYLHAYFLYHPIAKKYLSARAKGAIMAGLNMGIIKELPLVLPSLEEQKKLVTQVMLLKENVDTLKATYESKLAAIRELKKSILQKAFNGELTNAVE